MQTFGRIRVDVDNCLRELVNAGVVAHVARRADTLPVRQSDRP